MEAATTTPELPDIYRKSEFVNDSKGQAGAIIIENGREKAIPIKPGESILLSPQEQVLTANAPRKEKDNPFTNGTFRLKTPARHIATRRQIGDTSAMDGAQQADADAGVEERTKREAAAAERKAAEAKRTAEAQERAKQPGQPAQERPPAKPESQGGVEETAARGQEASDVEGKRADAEETAA